MKKVLSRYALTSLGEEKISLLHPLQDVEVIRRCLQQTQEVCRLLDEGRGFALMGVRDFRPALESVLSQGRVLEPGELLDIADTLHSAETTGSFLKKLSPEKFPRLHHLSGHFEDYSFLADEISRAISSQEDLMDSASPRLLRIREEIKLLDQKIQSVFRNILRNPRKRRALQSEQPTLRGDRLCLAIKAGYAREIRGMLLDSSHTGQTLFIEPEDVVPMGNRLAELRYNERDEINRILRKLTTQILKHRREILHILEVLGWVDFTQAKARMSIEYRMHPPEINPGGPLRLEQARHPLLLSLFREKFKDDDELFEKVVSLSLSLDSERYILMITGPNTGGKTIALKTLGLLSMMAQSGVPIPASPQSCLPLYDKVYAYIGDEQNLFNSLSTFSANMKRIIEILQEASPASLVLLDEFGSGTDPEEAAALGEAILNRMSQKRHHTVITTHLGFLKKYAFQNTGAINGSVEFDLEKLQPTYRLLVGVPGNSQALFIAKKLGMDSEIVEEAMGILNKSDDKQWIDRLQEAVFKAEREREAIGKIKEETQAIRDEALDEMRLLQKKREILEREVELEIERLRRRIFLDRDDHLKNLKGGGGQEEDLFKSFLRDALGSTTLEEKRRAYAKKLKKNKKVFLISLGAVGTITRINKSREELKVRIGSLEVTTNFRDVSWIGEIPLVEEWREEEGEVKSERDF